jgi:hypothetical protein
MCSLWTCDPIDVHFGLATCDLVLSMDLVYE